MRIKNAPEIGWYKDQSGIYPPVYYTGKDFIVSGPKFETVKGCVIELRRSDAFGSLDLVAARAWSRKELCALHRATRLDEAPSEHDRQDIRHLVAHAEAYAEEVRVVTAVEITRYRWRADRLE